MAPASGRVSAPPAAQLVFHQPLLAPHLNRHGPEGSRSSGSFGTVLASSASDNYEEGWDLNENDAGDFRVDMRFVDASRNAEEGIDFEEDDDFAGGGDLVTELVGIRTDGNGAGDDAGLKIREKGVGDLNASVEGVHSNDNLSGGISVREDSVGSLTARIERSTTNGNVGHGIDFDENRASSTVVGDLVAVVEDATSTGNGGAGVRADQQPPGVGTLTLTEVTLLPNGGGDVTGSNVTVTKTP